MWQHKKYNGINIKRQHVVIIVFKSNILVLQFKRNNLSASHNQCYSPLEIYHFMISCSEAPVCISHIVASLIFSKSQATCQLKASYICL